MEQIVDIPDRGGLQGSLPGQGSSSRRLLQDEDEGFQGVFRTFPQPKKSAKVTRQSSPRVPASVSSPELSAPQMAPAGESGELAGELGGALDPALADLKRWRRGLRRRDGEGGVEAAVAVLSRLASGSGQYMQLWSSTVALLWY